MRRFSFWRWLLEGDPPPRRRPGARKPAPAAKRPPALLGPATAKATRQRTRQRRVPSVFTNQFLERARQPGSREQKTLVERVYGKRRNPRRRQDGPGRGTRRPSRRGR